MKNNQITIALIVSLIIGGSILGYGYMNYKYKTETFEKEQNLKTNIFESEQKIKKEALEKEKTAENERYLKYLACQDDVQKGYVLTWNKNCSAWGKDDGCLLPAIVSKPLDELRQRNLDNCVKLYSAN